MRLDGIHASSHIFRTACKRYFYSPRCPCHNRIAVFQYCIIQGAKSEMRN